MPRALWWSEGGRAVCYARGTAVKRKGGSRQTTGSVARTPLGPARYPLKPPHPEPTTLNLYHTLSLHSVGHEGFVPLDFEGN